MKLQRLRSSPSRPLGMTSFFPFLQTLSRSLQEKRCPLAQLDRVLLSFPYIGFIF